MLSTIARFFNKPSVHIISGLAIIVCGLSNMENGMQDFLKHSNSVQADRIGLLFLGLSATILKGLLSIFKFFESTGKGLNSLKKTPSKITHTFKRAMEHWLAELLGGGLLLVCGLIEVAENWLDNDPTNNDSVIWFSGLMAVGFVKIFTTLPEMIEATVLFEHVEHKKGWNLRLVHLLNRKLRNPRLEVSLALFLVAIGLLEEFLRPASIADTTNGIKPHHGIIIYGILHLGKILPNLLASKNLIQDANINAA